MAAYATTRMSSKGQVVIPEEIRKSLNLKDGSQFMVIGENGVVILKELLAPSMENFSELLKKAEKQAKQAKLKRSDFERIISKAKKRK